MIKMNPDIYHGEKRANNFFEGWYFKIADRTETNVLAIIPGIIKGKDNPHSFIQVLSGSKGRFHYLSFPTEAFGWKKNRFEISIGDNYFSEDHLILNIQSPEISLTGEIFFKNIKKWPDSFLNPGSMGFYNYIPFMECYSNVSSVDSVLEGTLNYNGRKIDFQGGKGYIEKNWGKAFPYSWIWIQCCNFRSHDIALTCSIGQVPFITASFKGFLTGMYLKDEFFKFSTINRSKMSISKNKNDLKLIFRNKTHQLTINTNTSEEKFILINAPRNNYMVPLVSETLHGKVEISLKDLRSGATVVSDIGTSAGIEYGGNQSIFFNK